MAICQAFSDAMGSSISWSDFLVYPTTCFYYFWALILGVLFIILVFLLYNRERELYVQPDMISCFGVAAQAIFFLAGIATLITSTNGIPMLQRDLFLYVVALWILISAIWFWKR